MQSPEGLEDSPFKSFNKQNSKLKIHSKPDRNQSKLTVWSGGASKWLPAFLALTVP